MYTNTCIAINLHTEIILETKGNGTASDNLAWHEVARAQLTFQMLTLLQKYILLIPAYKVNAPSKYPE